MSELPAEHQRARRITFSPRNWLSLGMLCVYILVLIKIMIFKSVPSVQLESARLNLGGTNAGEAANLIPFKTIFHYLLGKNGFVIGALNVGGNIALLIPVGFLVPLVFARINGKQALLLAILSGLVIETIQVVLRVGIFDIDDVILNALGVILGYVVCILMKRKTAQLD